MIESMAIRPVPAVLWVIYGSLVVENARPFPSSKAGVPREGRRV